MTRYVVDASAVLHIVATGLVVAPEHELLAPTLLRSQTLSAGVGSGCAVAATSVRSSPLKPLTPSTRP